MITIAFLHTSNVHIERFENLVKKFDKNIQTKHYVNEKLLNYALKNSQLDSEGFKKELQNIKKINPNLIICTCSTYGEECDNSNDIKRIDFPITNYLVSKYKKIALVYTASSTERVSSNLIQRIANDKNKEIEILICDCSESWIHFENNNFEKYEKTIASKIKKVATKADVVFLAQASMEGVKKHLLNLGIEIFSSPEFGIKNYLNK
ncbi:hypothetical protein CXF68_01050 [Tenacibaculum sp. Bg11-29]|uniref:hypothetical protein n=1 Tax=Tenacibaculum sp. Bg11-29 TaxID=2058306 RepID=UPI000C34AD69|nr:hypothetical protein [Tenacibaculum sp. Bg11-29]PKH49358.1 hypothetical protein CXF68_01050 [Tenacibaculum sp. Bg11-29]